MPDFLLRLAIGNPNGTHWHPAVTVRTNTAHDLLAVVVGSVDPAIPPPGVRVHVTINAAIPHGAHLAGIRDGGPLGAGAFWPIVEVTPL